MSDIQLEPAAPLPDDRTLWFEWPVLFISWTFAIAEFRKKGREDAYRTKVIVQMNRFYVVASTALAAVVVAATCNQLDRIQWGLTNTTLWFRFPTFALAAYCLSRCIEVFYAFSRDAFDKLAGKKPQSDLDGRRRISLALASYAELILNFAMLLSLVPKDTWQTSNSNPPTRVTDVLFYSASTITTSGGGGYVPKGIVVQALTAFEIACGLILLVVCFAVYASQAAKPDDGSRRQEDGTRRPEQDRRARKRGGGGAGRASDETPRLPTASIQAINVAFEKLLDAQDLTQEKPVLFDEARQDMVLRKRRRGDQGKGILDLTHAAFTIGLQQAISTLGPSAADTIFIGPAARTVREADHEEELAGVHKAAVKQACYAELAERAEGSRQSRICYRASMSTERTKWRADRGSRALKRLAEIEASIIVLADEDLLDLADIFAEAPRTPLAEIAAAEVAKREIQRHVDKASMTPGYKRLEDFRIHSMNLGLDCGNCGHSGVIDGPKLWRWFALHRWNGAMDKVGEHMRCSVCKRRSTGFAPTLAAPSIDFGPRNEADWEAAVWRQRGRPRFRAHHC